jgi:hypothetical protein
LTSHTFDVDNKRFRLKRWPDAHLVRSYQQVKWATLMSANALSVDSLTRLSNYKGQPEEMRLFLESLDRVGLLLVQKDETSALSASDTDIKVKQRGFMGLIRRKLGI